MNEIEPLLSKLRTVHDTLENDEIKYGQLGLPENDPFWKCLDQFWSRPWFRRLWVLQEAVLAKEILFVCGSQIAEFDLLSRIGSELQRTTTSGRFESNPDGANDGVGDLTLHKLRSARKSWLRQRLDPVHVLSWGRWLQVREPVDRVYGLLGIMSERIRKPLKIDYTPKARREYWKLYVSVGKVMLEVEALDILNIAECYERPPEMPSWVANWNSLHSASPMARHFHAGFHGDYFPLPVGIVRPNSDSIKLPGFEIGTIVDTLIPEHTSTSDVNPSLSPEESAAYYLSLITDTLRLYRHVCQDPEDVLVERLVRTLVADAGPRPGLMEDDKYTQDILEDFSWYQRCMLFVKYGRKGEAATVTTYHWDKYAYRYFLSMKIACRDRRMFFTNNGRIGLGSRSCLPGDVVCIFFSAIYPFVLRKVADKDSFYLVSAAYTDGVMYGEALDARDPDNDRDFID